MALVNSYYHESMIDGCPYAFVKLKIIKVTAYFDTITSNFLKHNLFKNVSKWFSLWETQLQTVEYGPNDAKWIKKKEVTLHSDLKA